jgi:aldose 1-epimerase
MISAGGYEAVVTDAGGGLLTVQHQGRRLVAGAQPGEVITGGRGQVLVPWPNRLRDGAYSFEGRDLQLALSEPARHNASHGLVRWSRWQVVHTSSDAVRMTCSLVGQTGYPWSLDVSVEHAVSADGLAVLLSAVNRSETRAPFAAGMHPYLDAGCRVDDATLTLPAATHQRVDDRLLPAGTEPVVGDLDLRQGRSLSGVVLDDAFTDLSRDDAGLAVVRLEGRWATELWADESWRWVQAFTGDTLATGAREALAVEPMSAPADAFNSGTDLAVLEPGASWSGRFGIREA